MHAERQAGTHGGGPALATRQAFRLNLHNTAQIRQAMLAIIPTIKHPHIKGAQMEKADMEARREDQREARSA